MERPVTGKTFRRQYGSGHSYTLDGVPKIKGVTTMMRGLKGPPESYFTKTTAGYAVDNWDRLAALRSGLARGLGGHQNGLALRDLDFLRSALDPSAVSARDVLLILAEHRFASRHELDDPVLCAVVHRKSPIA